jgi:transcriptional regulator NrdR family protein
MARKKRAVKRRRARKGRIARRRAARKRPAAITIRRSSGRKEKFDLDRMARTTSRSGVPFLMAKDIAKNVSKQIKAEAKEKSKKTVTAGRVRKMIAGELRNRNQQTVASSYTGNVPENTQRQGAMMKVRPYESTLGEAGKDQHNVYRANRDSVLHDRSKRLASSA